ncbi:MAG: hypothetical protein DLM53_04790 [Candidatus Eremiobacter antarcticus]|nr:hypothetical protein [Candidatus Eremiobacteraeota bacterium]MBC5807900.1 hypothetical protein [Candidatus Eremiobacteraeota bacterium]PZR62730.1 MAG: hypothetical protein DLM53_04790 [Candidatus Eremiobacter sp. RRmetagenome_bin22]
MKRSFILSICLVAACVALSLGCSKQSTAPQQQAPQAAASGPLENPIHFPLYAGATVMAVKQFNQTVSAGQAGTGLLSSGAGTYGGNEVIAGSSASFGQLRAWVKQLEGAPPAGYSVQTIPGSMSSVKAVANKNGIDFALFRDAKDPKHGVLLVAMDPSRANEKLGPALSMLSKYQSLPSMLRENIDAGLKKRSGVSIEEITRAGSPLGVALNAMSDFRGNDRRAVLLVDAAKQ